MKVSFDFDDTLCDWRTSTPLEGTLDAVQAHAVEGDAIYVVTRRSVEGAPEVEAFIEDHALPVRRAFYTAGRLKARTLKQIGVRLHYDDDPAELAACNAHGIASIHVTEGSGSAGAGILFRHLDRRRGPHFLLAKRAPQIREGGLWGVPGGKVESGESFFEGAYREAQEELGGRPVDRMLSGGIGKVRPYLYEEVGGFRFVTFVVTTRRKAKPVLNWENTAAKWFSATEIMKAYDAMKLHFGVMYLVGIGAIR